MCRHFLQRFPLRNQYHYHHDHQKNGSFISQSEIEYDNYIIRLNVFFRCIIKYVNWVSNRFEYINMYRKKLVIYEFLNSYIYFETFVRADFLEHSDDTFN